MRLALCLLFLFAGDAFADDAVKLYKRGQEAFNAGRYEEAIEAFRAGYELDPRAEFLFNLAQSHRALGQRDRAITFLERFLREASPNHRLRPGAENLLAELRRAPPEPAAEEEPPGATPSPSPRPRVIAPPRVVEDPAPPRRGPTAPPPETPSREGPRVWVWVAAATAIVAIATTVFLVTTRDPADDVDDTIRLPPP